jgi:predicted nucleic-acid-binding protein
VIAIDTNVLVRLLTEDDPAQAGRARTLVSRSETAGEPVYVDDVVLAEAAWVLTAAYDVERRELLAAFRALAEGAGFAFADRSVLAAALDTYAASSADFADCLIVARGAAAGCTATYSFDRAMHHLEGARAL